MHVNIVTAHNKIVPTLRLCVACDDRCLWQGFWEKMELAEI